MTNEEMFNNNIKIAYKIAWKYKNCGLEFEDVKQISLYALWKAVLTFNNTHTFSTYAYIVIQNEINYYLRRNRKYFTDKYFSEPIGVEELTIEDVLADEANKIQELENKIDIQNQIQRIRESNIGQKNKKAFELYLKGYKQQKIADIMKCSQAQVSRYLKKIGGNYDNSKSR